MNHSTKRMRRREARKYLKEKHNIERTEGTLAKYASTGGGPEFHYVGRFPYYTPHGLDKYAESIISPTYKNTSEVCHD